MNFGNSLEKIGSKMEKGILFDLDGTLIDSMGVWKGLDRLFVEDYMKVKFRPETTDRLKSVSLEQTPEVLSELYGVKVSSQELHNFMYGTLHLHYSEKFEFKEGVEEKLIEIKELDFRMCVTTATDSALADLVTERLGLNQLMEFIYTPDRAGVQKGDPDFLYQAMVKLGTRPENTYVFDDALYALRNTVELGMVPVGVADDSGDVEKEKIIEISEIYLDSFMDLNPEDLL